MSSEYPRQRREKKGQRATAKQLTALKLINEGMPAGKAMRTAGYSAKVSKHPKKNLFQSQAITSIVDKFIFQLKDVNITTAVLAQKYAEWLNASEEVTVGKGENAFTFKRPDYKTQIEAGKMIKEIFKLTPTKEDTANITRRVTLEEYLNPEA